MIEKVLGGAPKHTIAELEAMNPQNNTGETTRVAPSPTGYMHIGGIYQALINWKIAKQTGGKFYLRIDDTDQKREIPGAVEIIVNSLDALGLAPDGVTTQSQRGDIYRATAADLLEKGLAYPCFMTQEDMDKVRAQQKMLGLQTGIYGEWARDRDITPEEIEAKLAAGEKPTIRLYSSGDPSKKIYCKDAVRGSMAFTENNDDIVLIKSTDGLPTYHFAHLVDDHFLRTTLVVRADEYLSTFPLHIQMFATMGWQAPKYIHTSTLDKIDEESGKQRKLSKRKDPEANVAYFLDEGWPAEAIKNYLFNIANSGFEEALSKNPAANIENYEFKIKKIPTSGALFDRDKLEWWAKEFIATLPLGELVRRVSDWIEKHGSDYHKNEILGDMDYLKAVLAIERDDPKRIRKDFVYWEQVVCSDIAFFFPMEIGFFRRSARQFINEEVNSEFLAAYNPSDTKEEWWAKIQAIAAKSGLKNGEVAMALRVMLAGREQTPDLYSMIKVMGEDRVRKRLKQKWEPVVF